MKPNFYLLLALLFVSFFNFSIAQEISKKSLVILPIQTIGVDSISCETAETILRHELTSSPVYDVIPKSKLNLSSEENLCSEIPCAISIGDRMNADEVLLCKFSSLGEKIIVQYMLIDVPSQKVILLDQTTSTSIEDLDVVMKRIAMSVKSKEPIEKLAEVDVIMDNETITPRRRGARKFTGFAFGYLFPSNGYDDSDRSFTMDFRSGAELHNYSFGMLLGIRKGFAVNIFGNYLATKTDVCPYIGGAVGFHWVSHDYENGYYDQQNDRWIEAEEKKEDGFEINANAGILLFRTYEFHLMANLTYSYTLNDFDDQAVIFTIGLIR